MSEITISAGEKYAVIAMESDIQRSLLSTRWPGNIWTTVKPIVSFDSFWKEWLGSIRAEHFDQSNFFIIAKMRSAAPEILDNENHDLWQLVKNYYLGILLSGRVRFYENPLLLTGGAGKEGISIRQVTDVDCPIQFAGINHEQINDPILASATQLAPEFPRIWDDTKSYKRLRRILNIYFAARTTHDILDRLHQYCRCIEGFIIPSTGQTARKFQSRTELFIGPCHHSLMKHIYEIRSAIEHMNDHLNLTSTTREDRAQIYQWATIVEFIARTCIVRVLENVELRKHFETDDSLMEFWRLPSQERRTLWGPIIDPLVSVHDFDARILSNRELGLPLAH